MSAVIGHEAALNTIRNAIQSGRIHHAWILSGPPGVGKFTVAREFARTILDPQSTADDFGLGQTALASPEGTLLESESHPDLHIIRKEDAAFAQTSTLRSRKQMNIPIDLLRERIIGGHTDDGVMREAPAWRKSHYGQGKVFILDEAELIDPSGQNALLKTLEEPPPDTWIVMVTSRPERLLQTVRSRCEHVRFGPLLDDEIREWISQTMPDVSNVDWIVQWADGAPGMAMLAEETSLAEYAHELQAILDDLDHGRWNQDFCVRIAEFINQRSEQVVKANSKASKDMANKQAAAIILRLLGSHVRRRLATVGPDDQESGRHLWALANRISETEDQLQRGLNLKHVLESLGAEWCQLCHS
ncbi:MAG: hypothetical protein CMJ29_01760 [Phycisphaerae bacterium]|nr:hypothetical protein [Phycisphaerae bacterium]MAT80355.1 hypothetical protein [Phycisphaerae bacterium]